MYPAPSSPHHTLDSRFTLAPAVLTTNLEAPAHSVDRHQPRRRANLQQGRALEILGHAIEYLVDSRMFLIDQPATPADAQATQILMRLNRQIFDECTEVVPNHRRLRNWLHAYVHATHNHQRPITGSNAHRDA